MRKMYLSVPKGTKEIKLQLPDKNEEELYRFHLMFVDSGMSGVTQVLGFGLYRDDGELEVRESEMTLERRGFVTPHKIEFAISMDEKVEFEIYYFDEQAEYLVAVYY